MCWKLDTTENKTLSSTGEGLLDHGLNIIHQFALLFYKPIIFLQHRTIRVVLTRIHFHALERTGLITTRQENNAT